MRFDKAFFESAYGKASQLPASELPEIAFAGRSNVGKSSLINKIFNRKSLARVSSTPGKTATVNFYNVETALIADLPGYGYAKVSGSEQQRWSDLMEGYFSSGRNIRLVVQLVDMRHSPTKLDVQMMQYLEHMGYKFVIALTKSDKLNKSETAKRLAALEDELAFLEKRPDYIVTSASKGTGIEELKSYIEQSVSEELPTE